MVRPAQHAHRRPRRHRHGSRAHRKPRRASARGFSDHAAAMAGASARAVARRRDANLRRARCGEGAGIMSQETKQVATLKIWRGSARDAGQWQAYEVPFEPGQSVLDGLRWLRIHKDPTLAVRFSCINANACKECMIQLDGDTVYACTAR